MTPKTAAKILVLRLALEALIVKATSDPENLSVLTRAGQAETC